MGLKSGGREPWLWDLKMFGRLQWQAARVDGVDSNHDDFNYGTTEVRRVYLGGQAKFLQYFGIKGRGVLARDRRPSGGDLDWQYTQLWDLGFSFDLGKSLRAGDLEALALWYGKQQLNISDEWHVSSRYLKTIERSAIANKVWPFTSRFANPTGGWLEARRGRWSATLGLFSTTHSTEFAPWQDGVLCYGETTLIDPDGGRWRPTRWNLAGFYQDVDSADERLSAGIRWTGSLAALFEGERWQCRANLILGDNGERDNPDREGFFGGVVILPSWWLVPGKLEAAGRYQFQGAGEPEGIRLWSRYARRAEAAAGEIDIAGGRGDRHNSLYAGLNYYLCSENLKVMGGVQYDDISSEGSHVYSGWTSMVAVRTFF